MDTTAHPRVNAMQAPRLRPLSCAYIFVLAVTFMSVYVSNSGVAGATKVDCAIWNIRVDATTNGPVDRTVFVQVTNETERAGVTVECAHRVLGTPDWLIRIGAETSTVSGNGDSRTITAAILLAVETLRRDYNKDGIGEIYLEPAGMSAEFTSALYEGVATEMRKLDSVPSRFNDRRVRSIVKKVYQEMDQIRHIKSELERQGFRVTVESAELCSLDRSLEGKRWKEIAETPAAGLAVATATCCIILEPVAK